MKIYTYSIEKIGNDKLLRKNVKTTVLSQNIELFNFNNTLICETERNPVGYPP